MGIMNTEVVVITFSSAGQYLLENGSECDQ